MGLFDVVGSLFGGGGGGQQDSTTTEEPWAALQPYLKDAYKRAQGLYNSGGPEFYPNATYVPFSAQQDMAMQLMQNRALMGNPLNQQAQGYVGQNLGMDLPTVRNALTAMNSMASGGMNNQPVTMNDIGRIKTGNSAPIFSAPTVQSNFQSQNINPNFGYGAISGQQINPNYNAQQLDANYGTSNVNAQRLAANYGANNVSAQNVGARNGILGNVNSQLNKTAQGGYLNNNPYLDRTYDRAADAVTRNYRETVMPSVNSTFSLSGRTGSGAHQGAVDQANDQLGRSLQGLSADIYGQDYAAERGRMQDAANQLGGFQLAGQGMNQNAKLANQAANLTAGQANQQAGMQANQQNLQALMANQSAGLTAAQANQQARLQENEQNMRARLANQQAKLDEVNVRMEAARANQNTNLQSKLANQASKIQTNTQNLQAQQANQIAKQNAAQLRQQATLANQQAQMAARTSNQDAKLAQRSLNMQGNIANQNLGWQLANLNQYGNNTNARNALDASNSLFNYRGQQQNYQNSLANMAPDFAQLDYGDMERLYGVGTQVQNQAQNVLNDSMDRFNFYQNRPEQQMDNYTAWLNGIPGSQFGVTNQNVDQPKNSTAGNFLQTALQAFLMGG